MAVLGKARLGNRVNAFRLNYFDVTAQLRVAGTARQRTIDVASLILRDVRGATPSTLTFTTIQNPGWTPTRGTDVLLGLGAINNLIFGGQIESVKQVYTGRLVDGPSYQVTCTDYTRLLNRRKVWATFEAGTTSRAAVLSLLTTYTSGFDTDTSKIFNVGTLDANLEFSGADVTDVLDAFARKFDATWFVDSTRRVHFETVSTDIAPRSITTAHPTAKDHAYTRMLRQVRTRVYVSGARSAVAAPVAAGQTILPVKDIARFVGGAVAVVGSQVLTYTGTSVSTDDTAALVAGTPQSIAAPAVALGRSVSTISVTSLTRSGQTVTVTTGSAHGFSVGLEIKIAGANQNDYNGTFRVASIVSTTQFTYTCPGSPTTPATGTITVQKVAGGDVDPGSHFYVVSAIVQRTSGSSTRNLETNVGTSSSSVTAASLDPPAALTAAVAHSASTISVSTITRSGTTATVTTSSAHSYAQGMAVTIAGANQSQYNGTFTIIRVTGATTFEYRVAGSPASPATGTITVQARSSGPLVGAYKYRYTYQSSRGETLGSAETSVTATEISNDASTGGAVSATVDGGLAAGAYLYQVTYVCATGETGLNGSSTTLTVTQVTAPSGCTATASTTTDGGLAAGGYSYRMTFTTARGETGVSGTSSATVSVVSAPGAPSAGPSSSVDAGLPAGTYHYAVTYVTAQGRETTGGTSDDATISVVTAPGAPSGAATTGGSLTPSTTYYYRITYVTTQGRETDGGTISSGVALGASDNAVNLSSIPTSGDARVTQRKIYRRKTITGTFFLVGTLNDNSTTTFGDGAADAGLSTVCPATNTTAGRVDLTSIPTSGDARVTQRKIYRTKVGVGSGGPYYLVTTLPDNSTTTFNDATPDTSLGALLPTSNTTAGQVNLTSIVTSADGRVSGRKVYRTKAGGSTYYLLTAIPDNTTTTFTDTTPDTALTESAPASNTTGGQINLSSIVTSGDPRVTGRRIYRTKAGGSSYYLLTTLPDNTTTTFTDTTPDTALTESAPAEAQNAGSAIKLLSVLTSSDPRVVGRTIYRTVAGGTEFRLVGSIGDNTTTTFTDTLPDASLGGTQPATNTFGGDAVILTSIALGPSGTIARNLYRTKAGGTIYHFVGSIGDNTTTTFTDYRADADLGGEAPAASALGPVAGDTTLRVSDLSKFNASGGWVVVAGQPIRYTGRAAPSGEGNLTGIPTSGLGAILADISVSEPLVNKGYLTGLPASGAGAVSYAIEEGASIRLRVTREDTAAQTALAALEGGDGIHEHTIDAGDQATVDDCEFAGDRELEDFDAGEDTFSVTTRDPNSVTNRTLTVNMSSPHDISADFTIQDVTWTGFEQRQQAGVGIPGFPSLAIQAGRTRLTLDDLLRMVRTTIG